MVRRLILVLVPLLVVFVATGARSEVNVEMIKRFAEQGDMRAQVMLGTMYYMGDGVAKDHTEAAKWLRIVAEKGDSIAQAFIGKMYYEGDSVPQDFAEAAKWLRLAAAAGEVGADSACYYLGSIYQAGGKGVNSDKSEAARWFRKAAEKGHSTAQIELGAMHYLGDGVPLDYVEAQKWFRMAAEKGLVKAQLMLAIIFFNGEGVPRDIAEAAKWFRMAAELGDADSQFMLGRIYSEGGKDVTLDNLEAEKWFRKAADQGHVLAKNSLNRPLRLPPGMVDRSLSIASNPQGARFYIYSHSNVILEGTTPFLGEGPHGGAEAICIEKEGYEAFWITRIQPGPIDVNLRPAPTPAAGEYARIEATSFCPHDAGALSTMSESERNEEEELLKKKQNTENYWRQVEGNKSAAPRTKRPTGPFIQQGAGSPMFTDTSTGQAIYCPGAVGKPVLDVDRDCQLGR